ncbi:MAG: glycosyltransferase N-terminal domain-containing protein [Rikenellaceae bacterium]
MIIYNLAIRVYSLVIALAAPFVPKAKLWTDGRKDLFARMKSAITPGEKIVWVHVASLGEFEQGRTTIEQLRDRVPEYKILLTFFSPSGYEVRKGYEGADYIFYLPIDTPSNVKEFLDIVNPDIAIFVKYEYWLNFLYELRRRHIRSYIVSAIFRKNSIFFDAWGGAWRRALLSFDTLFVQNFESRELLSTIGIDNVVVAGDTRFDRVYQISRSVKSIPVADEFKCGQRLFIAGSSWDPDDAIISKLCRQYPDVKFIIAPHEIDPAHIASVVKSYGERAVLYTQIVNLEPDRRREILSSAQVLVIDIIGILSSLYQYGDWCYIGGGFGVGIHNTLEAAIFSLPIAFGPNYKRFKEAVDMVELGACQSVTNRDELEIWFFELYHNEARRVSCGAKSRSYAIDNCGATNLFVDYILM